METLKDKVMNHPFFKGMGPEQLDRLAECATETTFEAGETILSEGQLANRFYLIQTGEVAVEHRDPKKGPTPIETLRAGDALGWSWLFAPYVWHFNARAVERTIAIGFDGARLLNRCEEDHHLGYQLMKRVSQVALKRLQAACRRLVDKEIATEAA